MNKREDKNPTLHSNSERTYSAAAVSGASQEKGQPLLPMLIAGLILIFGGMIAVVILVLP